MGAPPSASSAPPSGSKLTPATKSPPKSSSQARPYQRHATNDCIFGMYTRHQDQPGVPWSQTKRSLMPSFPMFENNLMTLKEVLSAMPGTVRTVMTKGFAELEGLSPEKLQLLDEEVGRSIAYAGDIDVTKFSEKIGVDKESASTIVTALSLLVALATSRKDEIGIVIDALISDKLVSQSDNKATQQVLKRLADNKDQLVRSMRIDALAERTLPSFKGLRTSVDMRLEFKAGNVDLFVPTVVARLLTDLEPHELLFQLKKSDIEELAEKMSKLLKDLAVAEIWAKGRV